MSRVGEWPISLSDPRTGAWRRLERCYIAACCKKQWESYSLALPYRFHHIRNCFLWLFWDIFCHIHWSYSNARQVWNIVRGWTSFIMKYPKKSTVIMNRENRLTWQTTPRTSRKWWLSYSWIKKTFRFVHTSFPPWLWLFRTSKSIYKNLPHWTQLLIDHEFTITFLWDQFLS